MMKKAMALQQDLATRVWRARVQRRLWMLFTLLRRRVSLLLVSLMGHRLHRHRLCRASVGVRRLHRRLCLGLEWVLLLCLVSEWAHRLCLGLEAHHLRRRQ